MSLTDPHPRIFLGPNNGRLAYLQAQKAANHLYYQRHVATLGSARLWANALDYIVDPTTGKRDTLLTRIDAALAVSPQQILNDRGLETGENIRDMALALDWCDGIIDHADATRRLKIKDYMLFQIFACFNSNDPWFRNLVTTLGWSGEYEPNGWGADEPGNNYFPSMMKGAMYAWFALHPNFPVDFNYPFGSGSNRQTFQLPYRNVANPVMYTDIGLWFTKRVEEMALPKWDYLMPGGGWHEGSWYGASPMRNILEMLSVTKDVADIDYIADRPHLADRINYLLFYSLAGNACFDLGEVGPHGSGASERISMLYAVNAMRGTAQGSYGQHWLNSDYSRAEASNPSSSYSHDFLLWDGRIQADDYLLIPKHHYAQGCGQVISRKDFGANDVAVIHLGYWQTQSHADHDGGTAQIYRAGHGGPTKYDGFLLCDAHMGSQNRQWETRRHCGYSLGGGAPYNPLPSNDPAGEPPAVGYEIRFGGNGNLPPSEISRQGDSPHVSYSQSNCGDGYRAMNGQGYTDTAFSYPKVNDVSLREKIHLLRQDVIVFYDRVRLIGHYAQPSQPGKIICWWHYPRQLPTDLGNGVLRITNYNNRMFRQYVFPELFRTSPPSTYGADGNSGLNTHYERVELPLQFSNGKSYADLMTVFDPCASSQANPVAIAPIYGLNGLVKGVTIKKTSAWHHLVFSAAQDGSTPESYSYVAERSSNSDRHVLANLVPGQPYQVTMVQIQGGQFYTYTVTPATSPGWHIANGGGVVEFTHSQLIQAKKSGDDFPFEDM